jgi:dTDP-4-amino-4,6-dideoxygalactose transaminase
VTSLTQAQGGAGPNEVPPERRGVPFLDLSHQNAPVRDEVLAEIGTLIDTGAFTNGAQVKEFEAAFAAFCGTTECVGVASGLDALRLALLAADVGAGDEVIVPAATFVATAEAVSQVGARPVLVDAAADDTLDPAAAEAALTPRTRAILPVHLYGQMADMARFREIAARHSVSIVEDACQAHGATRDGLRAGGVGSAGAFSFYPAKNLGAFGDAGALTTNDPELANRVRALREHGGREKYQHEFPGYTARLDTLQALVLLRKLDELERWNAERRQVAALYAEGLAGLGDLVLPRVASGSEPVWHLYVVRSARREALASFLGERGIGTGRHYPDPVHLTPAYASLGYAPGAFPVAERLSREGLSLPLFPGMTEAQASTVIAEISAFFALHGAE